MHATTDTRGPTFVHPTNLIQRHKARSIFNVHAKGVKRIVGNFQFHIALLACRHRQIRNSKQQIFYSHFMSLCKVPWIDNCLMVTKHDFLEMEMLLWLIRLNKKSRNGSVAMTKQVLLKVGFDAQMNATVRCHGNYSQSSVLCLRFFWA